MAGPRGPRRCCPAILVAAAVLAGCGGPSDQQQVRQTVVDFGRAVEKRDYVHICTQLFAARLVEQLQQVNLPCQQALLRSLGNRRDPRLTVGTVKVDGTTASAQIRTSATGEQPSQDTLQLVKIGGHWRISALTS